MRGIRIRLKFLMCMTALFGVGLLYEIGYRLKLLNHARNGEIELWSVKWFRRLMVEYSAALLDNAIR